MTIPVSNNCPRYFWKYLPVKITGCIVDILLWIKCGTESILLGNLK